MVVGEVDGREQWFGPVVTACTASDGKAATRLGQHSRRSPTGSRHGRWPWGERVASRGATLRFCR